MASDGPMLMIRYDATTTPPRLRYEADGEQAVGRPGAASGMHIMLYPAQHESFLTSVVKASAASFSPSTVVK